MADINGSIDDVGEIIERYSRDIERSIDRFEGIYQGYLETINEGDDINRGDIENMLYTAGYFAAVGAFLNNGYQEIIEVSAGLNENILGQVLQFSDNSLATIAKIKELDLSQFAKLGDDAVEVLQRGVTNLSLGIGTREQLLNQLSAEVLPSLQRYTTTWTQTASDAMLAESNVLLAQDSGISKFEYAGPLDGITRPFCRQHTGEIRTIPEWDKLDNGSGQPKPVSVYRGGWNCRHTLVPVE